jgi:hypothetical protein
MHPRLMTRRFALRITSTRYATWRSRVDQLQRENVPPLSPREHADSGAAAKPCARGHSLGTGAPCDPRAARPEGVRQRMYRGLYDVEAPGCPLCPVPLH